MRRVVFAFLFVVTCVQLQAGWIIREVSRYSEDDKRYETTVYFQKNLIKTVDEKNVTIFDLNKHEITFLDLLKKTYWKGSMEEYKKEIVKVAIENIENQLKNIPANQRDNYRELYENLIRDLENPAPAFYSEVKTRVEMTNEQRTILGYSAKKYNLYAEGVLREELWLANGIKVSQEVDFEKLRILLNEMAFGEMEINHRSSREYLHLLKSGYPLLSKEFAETGEIVSEVIQVERKQLPAEEFAIPSGFKKVALSEFENI